MPPHLHPSDNQSLLNKWKYPCVWDVFAVSSFKLKNHQSISCFSTPRRGLAWISGFIFSPISTISCRHSDGMILSDESKQSQQGASAAPRGDAEPDREWIPAWAALLLSLSLISFLSHAPCLCGLVHSVLIMWHVTVVRPWRVCHISRLTVGQQQSPSEAREAGP